MEPLVIKGMPIGQGRPKIIISPKLQTHAPRQSAAGRLASIASNGAGISAATSTTYQT